jgi:hypothetical protein
MRLVFALISLASVSSLLSADRIEDLTRIHLEAIGGMERIQALKSLRATGEVIAGGKQLRFVMTASRPNLVRLETEGAGRTLVQGTDGVEPPWEYDTGTWPPKSRPMADTVAKTFVADAEFDDPFVTAETRGYTLEAAGELESDGKKLHRVLVTHKLLDTYSLLLDDETFFVVARVEQRTSTGGRTLHVVTHYDDFRPVDGVLMAHKITVAVEGKATQQTKILRIEGNPEIRPEVFRRPDVNVPGLQKP